jgi:thymidylate kinase
MASIALIGPDGAGKTTVARRIESSSDLPIKYLYMGINTEASNVALPTSRFSLLLKKRFGRTRRSIARPQRDPNARRRRLASIRATARLLNMLADEWYRQAVSWWYQARGYLVLYDRYYLFDYSRHLRLEGHDRLSSRLHRLALEKLYPRPTLVVYLDAPAELLFARKREGTVESLDARRRAFLDHGEELDNFVRVDVAQPLSTVCREVADHIRQLTAGKRIGRLREQRP